MAGCIDQMKQVILIFVVVYHAARLCLDRNTALALHIEFVEELLLAPRFDCARELEEPVAEGALAMVNMGDNAEVSKAI